MTIVNKLIPYNETLEIAAKRIHLELLQIIETNIEGAKLGLDPEYLHHLRIAVRKIRSTLKLIPKVFSPQQLLHFRKEFAWLQQVTSQVRDLDVNLLTLQQYQNNLTSEQINALKSVIVILYRQQKLAQVNMNNELSSFRLLTLLSEWKSVLESISTVELEELTPVKSLPQVINSKLNKLHKKVIKDGRTINYHSSNETLHDLRKLCKKLRYMLEFFHYLYDSDTVKHVIKVMKRLTDELGIYQDLTVQASLMKTIHTQISAENSLVSATQIELNRLLTNIEQRHETAKLNFIQIFTTLDNACERNLFRVMLDFNFVYHSAIH